MTTQTAVSLPLTPARAAGGLYVLIIMMGVTSEFALRGPFLASASPTAAIAGDPTAFRLSLLGDVIMMLADIALALLLYDLLRARAPAVARAAMIFRLIQAALIGMGLIALTLVPDLASQGATEAVTTILSAHANGYDVALIFFAVNTALTTWLLARGGVVPRLLTTGLMAAALVYVTGGVLRLIAPDLIPGFQPAYLIPLLAETSLALWLLIAGRV